MMNKYFAYGSNLNATHLQKDRDLGLEAVGVAVLPGYRLAFDSRSKKWQGGALDVVTAPGCAVHGVLFEVPDAAAWAKLDAKEGVRVGRYRREEVVVLVDGEPHTATTYVTQENERAGFVAPTRDYLDVVAAGYAAFGIDPAPLHAAARGEESAGRVDALFVYGTLKQGECRGDVISASGPRRAGTIRGRLVDLGAFPGLLGGDGVVHGEWVPVDDLVAVLRALDEIEGFRGYLPEHASLYHRIVVTVTLGDEQRFAWTYRLVGGGAGWDELPGGVWPPCGSLN